MIYNSVINGFPYFSQNDERWNSERYGGGNIGSSGCGPTAAAMVLKSYSFDVTPSDIGALFTSAMGGYQTTSGGVCFPQLGNSPYNLTVKNSKNISEAVSALQSGIPVIANPHGPCDFTGGGHFIVLCGIKADGSIIVNDPNGNHYNMCQNKTWTQDYISWCCLQQNPVDGFWIISKNGSGSIGSSFSSGTIKRYTDFPKYDLSEDAIKDIATCITGEQGGTDVTACRQEASQIANLNEVTYGRSSTESSVLKTIHGGWYSSSSWTRGCTQTAIDAVRFVLIEGKRVLPRYVTEHDMFPLDAAISGHWNNGSGEDRSQYKRHETTIRQNPSRFRGGGSSYTFYCFFGSDASKDVAGYYSKDYERYKGDIPWTEGADNESYAYSENSYAEENKEPTVVWNNRVKECIQPKLLNFATKQPTGKLRLYAEGNDITDYMSDLSWKNATKELATTMSFNTARSDVEYIGPWIYVPKVGDVVQLVTNEEVFRGVILTVDDGDRNSNKYTAADLGWYLNKTMQTYQFKSISAKTALEEVCKDLSIPIVSIPELTTIVNQIYFDETISDIISDILDLCGGGNYTYDFTPEGIRIYEIGAYRAYPEFRIADNLAQDYSPNYRGNVSHSLSIEEMRNSIKVTSEKDNVYTELVVEQNREMIDKYGFLQEIVKIDPEKENAQTTAKDKLKEMAAIGEAYSFEIIEKYDSYTRAGEVIAVDGTDYVIESTTHTYSNGWHKTQMDVKRIGG